jgi:hypothetical protein
MSKKITLAVMGEEDIHEETLSREVDLKNGQ